MTSATAYSLPMTPAYFDTHFLAVEPPTHWPSAFAIITAYATTGETWTSARNEAADRELETLLRERGCMIGRVTGYSPQTHHAEPGWAAALTWQDACDLGQQFRQDAIYWVAGDDLSVTFCDARRALVTVGSFHDRVTHPLPGSP